MVILGWLMLWIIGKESFFWPTSVHSELTTDLLNYSHVTAHFCAFYPSSILFVACAYTCRMQHPFSFCVHLGISVHVRAFAEPVFVFSLCVRARVHVRTKVCMSCLFFTSYFWKLNLWLILMHTYCTASVIGNMGCFIFSLARQISFWMLHFVMLLGCRCT